MMFLQILLAVAIVIVVVVVGGLWFLKHWFRRVVGDHTAAAQLVDQRWLRPARIRLRPSNDVAFGEGAQGLWSTLGQQGFHLLADFEDQNGEFMVRAGQHQSYPVTAVVVEDSSEQAFFTLLAIDSDKTLTAITNEVGVTTGIAHLDWHAEPGLSVEAGLKQLKVLTEGMKLLTLSAGQLRAAWEQSYAARMDRSLVHPPSRDQITANLEPGQAMPAAELLDRAHEMMTEYWRDQLESAALDHYRRSGQIDAATWERIEDQVHVVHGHLAADDIKDLLVDDEVGEQVFQQCLDQGFNGVELYDQVLQRLPGYRRLERLYQVKRPVRAFIYGPTDDAEKGAAGQFLYRASDGGKEVHGAVIAQNARDAKLQLANMGLENTALMTEPTPLDTSSCEEWTDPEVARIAARSAGESITISILRAFASNLWIWGPPAGLVAWTLWVGLPFDWFDYLGIGYALLAAGVIFFLIAPVLLYDQFNRARVTGRWNAARFLLATLAKVSVFGSIGDTTLLLERLKILAAQGDDAKALGQWQEHRAELGEAEYQAGLIMLYDAAGNHEKMIQAQRAAMAESSTQELHCVDLAMSLARFGDFDEADDLLARISPQDLTELAAAGYQYSRAMIAARRGHHELALRQFGQAIRQVEQYKSNPLLFTLIAEINGHAAISLKRLGQLDRAAELWTQVWPLLRVHRGSERLAMEYEGSGPSITAKPSPGGSATFR